MRPLFVTINKGQPDVHWAKLSIFCLILMVVTGAAAVGAWYLLSGTWSIGALIVGLVFGVTMVVRVVVRAITYQEQEIESESSVLVS